MSNSKNIHPTAIIADGATIADDVTVGAYSVIGAKVTIGKGTRVASHVVIDGRTTIGEGNNIFQFASIGAAPQDLKYKGEDTLLEIGDKNIIREYATLQPGTAGGHGFTKVGNNNLFMVYSHIGHDGIVGNNNVFANSCALAGHVTVGNNVIVGGLCGIHQFVKVGDFSMLGGGSMVGKDVPPYCITHGDHAGLVGINQIGLERHGFSPEQIQLIRRLFREIFMGSKTMSQRLALAQEKYGDEPLANAFIQFILNSERGVMSLRRRGGEG
ncbi:MAG: acyl-ACP--UDP-N-acetylglucosamine O-acyltransferase [Bdellovibrionota bacterium]|jgi:UDP-N-acetylglucosamine acyltransferase